MLDIILQPRTTSCVANNRDDGETEEEGRDTAGGLYTRKHIYTKYIPDMHILYAFLRLGKQIFIDRCE